MSVLSDDLVFCLWRVKVSLRQPQLASSHSVVSFFLGSGSFASLNSDTFWLHSNHRCIRCPDDSLIILSLAMLPMFSHRGLQCVTSNAYCVFAVVASNAVFPTNPSPAYSGMSCNQYLPSDTMDRFLWVINYFATNGFYVVSTTCHGRKSVCTIQSRLEMES